MSFEDNLQSRLPARGSEPPETDLDYYARPENYTGSNMMAIQRVALAWQNQSNSELDKDERSAHNKAMSKIMDRYYDVGVSTPRSFSSPDCDLRRGSVPDIRTPYPAERKGSLGVGSRESSARWRRRPSVRLDANSLGVASHDTEGRTNSRGSALTRSSRALSATFSRNPQYAKERFRHAIKTILILMKWISSLSEKSNEIGGDSSSGGGGGGGKTFTDIANEAFDSGEPRRNGLTFDLSQFKAKKEINISSEVKSILCTPTIARSPDQLQIALYGLQHLKSFAEYPLHMQEKLCKVAWFQHVPPKRVIIRQGHYAENFYFILSGQAVVRILDKNPSTGEVCLRTAAVMRKGTSFGELALLHRSRRTATVVSNDAVQLLTIGRDDFFDIFMSGQGPGQVPEHVDFVRSLDFMKDWPTDNLIQHPESCLFHFFKRGVVIVKDSSKSDWIYIVKSGSCQVIKQLKGVVPKARLSQEIEAEKFTGKNFLPRLALGDPERKTNTGLKQQRNIRPKSSPASEYDRILRKQDSNRPLRADDDAKNDLRIPLKEDGTQRPTTAGGKRNVAPGTPRGFSKSRYSLCPKTRRAHFMTKQGASTTSISTNSATTSRQREKYSRSRTSSKVDLDVPLPPGVGSGPVFVQVEVLQPKDAFGLNTVNFDGDDEHEMNGTIVSLVSNGAECIMLSKKMFMNHANEMVKHMIRRHVSPYPSEVALQENLQTTVDWEIYKHKLVKDVVDYKALLAETQTYNI